MYHEHLRSYSLKSLVTLFDFYDFTVVDAERVDRYGGSLRVVARKGRGRAASPNVGVMLSAEQDFGLYDAPIYNSFAKRTRKAKRDLVGLALEAEAKSQRLVGNSCPARASTLLNYCGLGRDLMPYIAEQPTSLKLDKYLPGLHIPIIENGILLREQPDYVVLLAWHIWRPIADDLRRRGLRSKFVVPLPEVRVIELLRYCSVAHSEDFARGGHRIHGIFQRTRERDVLDGVSTSRRMIRRLPASRNFIGD